MKDMVIKAREYAVVKHSGQKYGDNDYVYHLDCVHDLVIEMYSDDPLLSTLETIAYLHDVAEDCDVKYEEIVKEFNVCVAVAVMAISKVEGENKQEYLNKVLGVELARKVKIADTLTNLMHSFVYRRAKGMNKYPEQLMILQRGKV